MEQWKKDFLYGIIISALSIVFAINTQGMDDSVIEFAPAKAGNYTRFWLILLCALGVLLVIKALIKRDKTKVKTAFNPASVFTIVSLIIYVFSLNYLGFLISTIIFIIVDMIYFTWKADKFKDDDGNRIPKKELLFKILIICVISVAVTLFSYLIFGKIIGLLLPTFNLW